MKTQTTPEHYNQLISLLRDIAGNKLSEESLREAASSICSDIDLTLDYHGKREALMGRKR